MRAMADRVDFEAEGLLDDLQGAERVSRLELLEQLHEEGVPLEELREAVSQGRLAFLPLERALVGEPRYTPLEVAERAGVTIEVLEGQWRSMGIAVPARDAVAMSREDLEAAHRQRALMDAGLDLDSIAELGRTIAMSMSQFAAASRQALARTFFDPTDTEAEVSERIDRETEALLPLVAPTLEYAYRLHLREQLRHAVFEAGEGGGTAPGSEVITVAFADLVGYTELGEDVPPEELGRVTGRLDAVARDVAHGPVRLVKLIGDAAMFASPDTTTLLGAVLDLIDEMGEEGEYPLIRAGVARGPVVSRAGDYYGAPVNLASRITGVARPGSVLTSVDVREVAGDAFSFSKPIRRHLKGISGAVELHRCRDLAEEGDQENGEDGEGAEGAEAAPTDGDERATGSRLPRRRHARRS